MREKKVTYNTIRIIKISSIILMTLTIFSTSVPVNASVLLHWNNYSAIYQENKVKGKYNVTIWYRLDTAPDDPWYKENILINKTSRNWELILNNTYPNDGLLEVYVRRQKGIVWIRIKYREYMFPPGVLGEPIDECLLKKI